MARHFFRKGDKVQAYHLGKLVPGIVQQNMGNGPRVIVLLDGEAIARQFSTDLVEPASVAPEAAARAARASVGEVDPLAHTLMSAHEAADNAAQALAQSLESLWPDLSESSREILQEDYDHWRALCDRWKAASNAFLAGPSAPQAGTSTYTHGLNSDCPNVRSGEWTRCLGHTEPIPTQPK